MAVAVTVYPALDATSYVTLEEFRAWCDQRLKDISGKTDDQLAAAVNGGSEYMDIRFDFGGYRKEKGQEREFPRESLWDVRGDKVDGVPRAVKAAACAYSFLALSTDLMPSPTRDDSGQAVKSREEQVGPIKEKVEYDTVGGLLIPIFPSIDRLLFREGYVCRRGGGISVSSVERG